MQSVPSTGPKTAIQIARKRPKPSQVYWNIASQPSSAMSRVKRETVSGFVASRR